MMKLSFLSAIFILFFLCQPIIVYSDNWQVDLLFADARPTKLKKMQVAILDTGIDSSHELIKDNIAWEKDLTGSGVFDSVGHGTAVSSIVVQINPLVEIYNIKIADSANFSAQYIFDGIISAVRGPDNIEGTSDDADVINLSFEFDKSDFGSSDDYNDVCHAWNNVFKIYIKSGVIFVAAGGNSGDGSIESDEIAFPANSPYVIGVGGISQNKNIWSGSSSGEHIEISAPANQIYCAKSGGGYATYSGTSLAAPAVCGIISIYLGEHGHMSVGEKDDSSTESIRGILHTTAEDLGDEGYDKNFGYGLVQYKGVSVFNIQQILIPLIFILVPLLIIYIKRNKIRGYMRSRKSLIKIKR